MATPRAALEATLGADGVATLDDAGVGDYIEGLLGDADTSGDGDDDLLASIAPLLVDVGVAADEEAAEPLARSLLSAMRPAAAEAAATGSARSSNVGGGPPRLLSESVSLQGADGAQLFKAPEEYELGGRLVGIDEAMDERKKRKAQREEERRATRKAHDKVAEQRAREEALLEEARVAAVRLRRERGAYLGAVEAKPFSLPNPGGGADLLEGATFTLQRGRRYGLIGRNGSGKSTLLRSLASRQLGDIPAALTIHYVSQAGRCSIDVGPARIIRSNLTIQPHLAPNLSGQTSASTSASPSSLPCPPPLHPPRLPRRRYVSTRRRCSARPLRLCSRRTWSARCCSPRRPRCRRRRRVTPRASPRCSRASLRAQTAERWPRDGREMAERWPRDGREMAE